MPLSNTLADAMLEQLAQAEHGEFSTPEMFQFLDDPGRLKHLNLFLGQIGREAARTPGGAGRPSLSPSPGSR